MTDDGSLFHFIVDHPVRLVAYTLTSALGWLIAWGLKKWFSKKCRWDHKKKYVELTYRTNYQCSRPSHQVHTEDGWWATIGRWVCEEPECDGHGEDCFGTASWWKIEYGKMVPDKKLLESPPKDFKGPKQHMNEVRAKKTAGKPVTVEDIFHTVDQMSQKMLQKAGEMFKKALDDKEKASDLPKDGK